MTQVDTKNADPAEDGVEVAVRADGLTNLGLILASAAVFGMGGALAVIWSGGTLAAAVLGYMLGGWLGLSLAVLPLLRRDDQD